MNLLDQTEMADRADLAAVAARMPLPVAAKAPEAQEPQGKDLAEAMLAFLSAARAAARAALPLG
jgi:hypothetical protein